jgi:hypothetical protein
LMPGIGPATEGLSGFELFSAPTQLATRSADTTDRILSFFIS